MFIAKPDGSVDIGTKGTIKVNLKPADFPSVGNIKNAEKSVRSYVSQLVDADGFELVCHIESRIPLAYTLALIPKGTFLEEGWWDSVNRFQLSDIKGPE